MNKKLESMIINEELAPFQALKEIRQRCGETILKMFWDKNGQHIDFTVNDECDIIETALKVNKQKLDLIGGVLVDIAIGAIDFEVAFDRIREALS